MEPRDDRLGRTFVWILAIAGLTMIFVGTWFLYDGSSVPQRDDVAAADRDPALDPPPPHLDSLEPALEEDGVRHAGTHVRLAPHEVERAGPDVFTIRSGGREVVVLLAAPGPEPIHEGMQVRIMDGTLRPVTDLHGARPGLVDWTDADLYVHAVRVEVVG